MVKLVHLLDGPLLPVARWQRRGVFRGGAELGVESAGARRINAVLDEDRLHLGLCELSLDLLKGMPLVEGAMEPKSGLFFDRFAWATVRATNEQWKLASIERGSSGPRSWPPRC